MSSNDVGVPATATVDMNIEIAMTAISVSLFI